MAEEEIIDYLGNLCSALKEASDPEVDLVLLSGGLDSSIVAALHPNATAVTITLERLGDDRRYAQMVAKHLGLEHIIIDVSMDVALRNLPLLIRLLRSFDPALLNDLAIFIASLWAKENGFRKAATGDGGDELFAGYDYMIPMNHLESYIKTLAERMEFSTKRIMNAAGLDLCQPFLDKGVIDEALRIPCEFKVREGDHGTTWGKWILRKSYEKMLPDAVLWREKEPIEVGSGFSNLRSFIIENEMHLKLDTHRHERMPSFLAPEQAYFYNIYLEEIGDIPQPNDGEKSCSFCRAGIPKEANHCRVCGGYPQR